MFHDRGDCMTGSDRQKKSEQLKYSLVIALCIITLLYATSAIALIDLTIFGPKRYDRLNGKPTVYTDTFQRCNPATEAIIKVTNGDSKKTRIKSASIQVNGSEVVSENEFKQQVPVIEKIIHIRQTNELRVVLKLKSGMQDDPNSSNDKERSFLIIEILGKGCDDTPPAISSPEPSDGSLLTVGTPRIAAQYADNPGGTGIDASTVRITLDGTDVTSSANVSASGVSYTPSSNLPEGAHSVAVSVSDRAHNPANLAWRFTTDTVAPRVAITSHGNQQYLNAPLITLSGTIDDPSASVTVNGRAAVVSASGFSIANLALSEGPNTILVEATDPAGNRSGDSIVINLDTVPPVVQISSPQANTKVKTPVIAVFGTVSEENVSVTINGIPASINGQNYSIAALTLIEGTNTIQVEAKDRAGNSGTTSISITLDTVPPLVINPVTTPTSIRSQTITGSRASNAVVTVTVNTTALAGLVTYPTASTWSCTITALIPGANGITVTARDAAGNATTATVSITVILMELSNISISRNILNTATFDSTTIFFTLTLPATVTLKIIPEKLGPTGTPVYQASQTISASGAYSFTWDGKDNTGKVVPDEAYLYVLAASDGTRTDAYSPAAPTGTGTVTCSQSTGFDFVKNLPMSITYTPTQASRVNISISWGGQNFKIQDAVAATTGSHTYVWDGRNSSNTLLDAGAQSSCSVASLLRENYIITTGDTIRATELKTDPYTMQLAYGHIMRIKYTLPREAKVTVKLTSPTGAVISLINNQLQTAGPQEIDWNGMDTTDTSGKKALFTEVGDYMVSVQTVNPVTGTSSTARGYLRIGY